ncbi:unnamed protein product [Calicophoron daubneyi]|uniref:Band 4.1 domain-containing protein n=1 Tax=Calicophoron daubneyi TaxID=300641 RepID=A0AAV2TKC5_CALDB
MLADGEYVDGSWLLHVHIDELDIDREVRVQGDWSLGEFLTELTEGLTPPTRKLPSANEISLRTGTPYSGWADYQLWWPVKSRWLTNLRVSLNQYGLHSDAYLRLVPVNGRLRVQLPDLQIRDFVDVNYAEPVFRITVAICRNLNIRHPEELSLAHPVSQNDLKNTRFAPGFTDHRHHALTVLGKRMTFQRSATISGTHPATTKQSPYYNSLNRSNRDNASDTALNTTRKKSTSTSSRCSETLFGPPRVRERRSLGHGGANWYTPVRGNISTLNRLSFSPGSLHTLAFDLRTLEDPYLASSPLVGIEEAFQMGYIVHPNGFIQRLRLNASWLDSSRSLMEQGIDMCPATIDEKERSVDRSETNSPAKEALSAGYWPTLKLQYKYGSYYDLNAKYDEVRINQLYEQAKWSVLSELIEATDDEACLLAALQAHVEIATEQEMNAAFESPSPAPISMNGHDQSDAARDGISPAAKKVLAHSSTSRDTSPIGGYLRHKQNPKLSNSRPMSAAELDSEIDALLDDLANSTMDVTDSSSIGTGRRSRSRRRPTRPLSLSGSPHTRAPQDPGPPQLHDYIKICKPRRFGIKVFRRLFVSVDRLKLSIHKNEEEFKSGSEISEVIYLPGCEVQPDLCLTTEKFSIRLFVPISRTNLPLSAAFSLRSNADTGQNDEDVGLGGRLRRRASLLSLTSLSQFGAAFGLQSTQSSSGGLCGASAAVLGLVNEVILRFTDAKSYTEWLAYLRLATAVPCMGLLTGDEQTDLNDYMPPAEWASVLTRDTFDAECRAITALINLISPSPTKGDQMDSPMQFASLHDRLEKRLVDFLPVRLGLGKIPAKTSEFRKDQTDQTLPRNATLPADGRPPVYSSSTLQSGQHRSNFVRRICIAYSRIQQLSSTQAKLKYISAWEQMPNHGIAFFPARIEVTLPLASLINSENSELSGPRTPVPWLNRPTGGGNVTVSCSRRVEAVGIGPTRVFRCDLNSGEIMASWRLTAIQGWHINWELGELVLLLAPPQQPKSGGQRSVSPAPVSNTCAGRVIIRPVDVSVRIVAEYLGGYAFLSLRSPEKNQCLDESIFYKLTTGYALPLTLAGPKYVIHA